MEFGKLYRVKKIIVRHPVNFCPFFKAPAKKVMAHSQITSKSLLNHADSETYSYFLMNAMVA